jgi:hypothetical protein
MIELTKSDVQFVPGGWYYVCLGPAIGAISGAGWAFSIAGTEDFANQHNRTIILNMAVSLATIGAIVGLVVGWGID